MDKERIAVWFSNGAASAVALRKTIEIYGKQNVRALNCPVIEEEQDNLRFQDCISNWCDIAIERVTHKDYPLASAVEVWDRRKGMSFPHGAPCTVHLKKEARQQWEVVNKPDWHVLGFTADEVRRHQQFVLTERENVIPVLIDLGLTKADCANILREAGIQLPAIYGLGFPNANCIGCVKATSPTYWSLVRDTFPDVYASRAEQSRRLGVRLVRYKGERLFLDELPVGARGNSLKALPDCSAFCEEKPLK